jgi:hypothetical protein
VQRYYAHWAYALTFQTGPQAARPALILLVTTSESNPFLFFPDQPYSATTVNPGIILVRVDGGYSGTIISRLFVNTAIDPISSQPAIFSTNGGRTYYGVKEVDAYDFSWAPPGAVRVRFDYQNEDNTKLIAQTKECETLAGIGQYIFVVRSEWANDGTFFSNKGPALFDLNSRVFKPAFGVILHFGEIANESYTGTINPGTPSPFTNNGLQRLVFSYGSVTNYAPFYFN